jgi:hypothetical protein
MLNQKIKLFLTPFCNATPVCLFVMVQGNIWLVTVAHLQTAVETGFVTGVGVLALSLFAKRWFSNKYFVAGITGGVCFIADLLIHPTSFGSYTTEAIVTGTAAAITSLAASFVGKKLFMLGKAKLTKGKTKGSTL